ncbi:hypothetical protein ABZ619_10140 [Streptomyces sp. NPDC007851]|uniref:hypothetical protein n=1 Tax=Streptomyces sp. NPDC007851 TaxID=3155008 RepID=UPI0033FF59F4
MVSRPVCALPEQAVAVTSAGGAAFGVDPARAYVHGLGAAPAVYHALIAARPELVGGRSLFVDLPGAGRNVMFDNADAFAAVGAG